MIYRLIMLVLLTLGFHSQSHADIPNSIYEITVTDINGKPLKFSDLKNKVILIVNVASNCGFTSQYKQFQELYDKYHKKGLVIIGVPSNDFFQEPKAEAQIGEFCKNNYGVTFPLTKKLKLNGAKASPLYKYLTAQKGGRIMWNFTKFLINPHGVVIKRYSPKTKPTNARIIQSIEKHLP